MKYENHTNFQALPRIGDYAGGAPVVLDTRTHSPASCGRDFFLLTQGELWNPGP